MAKEIILYNLADNVTDEQYKDFVRKVKGPLLGEPALGQEIRTGQDNRS